MTDITAARTAVGTGLTAIDLAGLTRVELGFGLLLTLAAGGLVLGLSRAERRRRAPGHPDVTGRRAQPTPFDTRRRASTGSSASTRW